jgi:hypothetical protein
MPRFFTGHLPDVLYHGTTNPEALANPCPPAAESQQWRKIPWRTYDSDDQEARMAYANVVFDGLGLRDRREVPDWAKSIRSIDDLAGRVGILFVTDNRVRAESLYGPVVEIDMTSPVILDVVKDPNTMTHDAWILVLKLGEPIPVLSSPDSAPFRGP